MLERAERFCMPLSRSVAGAICFLEAPQFRFCNTVHREEGDCSVSEVQQEELEFQVTALIIGHLSAVAHMTSLTTGKYY